MTQSSYLMSFIRSLMENSKDIREKKKRQLERDFNETGAVLNTCLTEKFSDVNKILNVYNNVSRRVSANRSAITKIKRDLIDCKSLLYCNREELRRLWLELVEQRRCLELIDQLDRLRSTPDALGSLVGAHAWPEATSLIIHANDVLTSEIASVPAVQSLKSELAHKQKFLIDELKKELDVLIFERPKALALERRMRTPPRQKNTPQIGNLAAGTVTIPEFEKSGASKAAAVSQYVNLPLSEWNYTAVSEVVVDPNLCKEPRTVATAIALSASSNTADSNNRHASVQSVNWIREIVAVAHCLVRLQKLPQILCDWRPQSHISEIAGSGDVFSAPLTIGQGLLGQIHRSIVLKCFSEIETRAISRDDSGPLAELSSTRYLIKLLELIFSALFMNARCCLLLLRTMSETKQRFGKPIRELKGLNSQYIWSCVQYEIFCILLMHLNTPSSADSPNNTTSMNGSSFPVESDSVDLSKLDLNSLMGRKRLVPFTFSSSSGSLPNVGSDKSSKQNQNPTSTTQFATNNMNFGAISNVTTGTNATSAGPTTSTLFSFANTSHYMGMSSYLRETRVMGSLAAPDIKDQLLGTEATHIYPLVCRPSRDNILSVYKIIMEFIEAIELEMGKSYESAQSPKKNPSNSIIRRSCQLRSQLKTFIETVYLPGTLNSLRLTLQQKMSAPDAINTVVSQQIERELGLNRPILAVVHTVDECLTAVRKMCVALPEYRMGCVQIGLNLLDDFIVSIWRIYRSLSEVDASGTLIPSADWSKDIDVSRFWKKFPTWQRMATHEARMFASTVLMDADRAKKVYSNSTSPNGGQETMNKDLTTQTDSGFKTSELSTNSNLTPATAVALGLFGESEGGFSAGLGSQSRVAVPFANEIRESTDLDHDPDKSLEFMRVPGLIYEREATRLAATETDQLIHMIRDELPDSSDKSSIQLLPTMRNVQLLKTLGRLTESLCWLCQRVLSLDTWLKNLEKNPHLREQPLLPYRNSTTGDRKMSILEDSAFSTRARELNRFSEACLLMTYLEVRIQAYNHFGHLPPNVTYFCPVDEVDVDKYVTDFLSYVEHVRDLLLHTFSRHKFRFIFDGLGDFISQLLLRLIPQIVRMNTNGNKKMCRNVYRLQQTLATLTETHESDLIRVKQLYELFYLTPETIVNRLIEQGAAFDEKVYIDLMQLYQRSHSTYDYSKTQASIAKLANVIRTNPK